MPRQSRIRVIAHEISLYFRDSADFHQPAKSALNELPQPDFSGAHELPWSKSGRIAKWATPSQMPRQSRIRVIAHKISLCPRDSADFHQPAKSALNELPQPDFSDAHELPWSKSDGYEKCARPSQMPRQSRIRVIAHKITLCPRDSADFHPPAKSALNKLPQPDFSGAHELPWSTSSDNDR